MRQCWKASAAWLLLVLALPRAGQGEEPTDEELLGMFDPLMAMAMGRLSADAYCGHDLEIARVYQCEQCEKAGFQVVNGSVQTLFVSFFGNPEANFFILGQFARSDDAKDIPSKGCFVAVRGSINTANWVTNFQNAMVNPEWPDCPDCRFHQGYWGVFLRAKQSILKYLDANGCGKDGDPIYVTGHSLGGASATLIVAALTHFGYNVALSYLLEPPMVGNKAFRDWFKDNVARNHPPVPVIRLTNGQDASPSYPYKDNAPGYFPVPYEFHSDPVLGVHRVCRHLDESCAAGVNHNLTWAKNSLRFDHVILWYAPHHSIILSMVAVEWCKLNPNPFLFQMELTYVSMYVFLFEAGMWNAVIRCSITLLALIVAVVLCVRCCCCRHKTVADKNYKRLSAEQQT